MAYKVGRPKKGEEKRGYKGNDLLKKTKINIEWNDELIEEFTKCATDVKYFIEKYVNIISIDEGKGLFKLRDYQEEIIDLFSNENKVVLMLPRQCGKCQSAYETVVIRNKKTGIIETIPVGKLYERVK